MSFWNFPPDSKLDVLKTNNDTHLRHLVEAICDKDTEGIDQDGKSFTIYGRDQALIIIPESLPMYLFTICLSCYYKIMHLR